MDSRLRGNDNGPRAHPGVIPSQAGIHADVGQKSSSKQLMMKKGLRAIFCIFAIGYLLLTTGANTQSEPKEKTRYVTWEIWEVDRVASIWLMKRYVDTEAEFAFVKSARSVPTWS